VLDTLFHALVRYAAPVLVFTTEEVWGTRYPDEPSVHLLEWPLIDTEWREDPQLEAKWAALRDLREAVTEAIEPLRRDKIIGSSLEAQVTVASDEDPALLAELFIVSSVKRGNALGVAKSSNHKCGRCWRLLPEVRSDGDLCDRCEAVVG
jgi:isoleucyl-tRNA synthetase